MSAEWGHSAATKEVRPQVFSVDIVVEALDRPGLLRDISEVFTRDKLNVTGVNTISKGGRAHMRFTIEVVDGSAVQRATLQIQEVDGVRSASRA